MGNGVRCVKGSMTVEAMFLLPVVLGVLYAAAVYGITFFAKYQIQDVVDRAVASGLYVDRSAFAAADISAAVEARANDTLQGLKNNLPESWRGRLEGGCEPDVIGDIDVILCSLTYPNFKTNPITPSLNFGWLGTFPPLPDALSVEARAAF
ncbi:TadE/TadG family type IV pilus assembly protein [Alloalcanivorax xenomutans]|jgi:hypothetical protein